MFEKFNDIIDAENLNEQQILDLYSDIIEAEYISGSRTFVEYICSPGYWYWTACYMMVYQHFYTTSGQYCLYSTCYHAASQICNQSYCTK